MRKLIKQQEQTKNGSITGQVQYESDRDDKSVRTMPLGFDTRSIRSGTPIFRSTFDHRSVHSVQSAFSQFEMDIPQNTEFQHYLQLYQQNSINTFIDDEYERLDDITERGIRGQLKDEPILFDSSMKVYSATKQGYIDVAGILTKKALYFTSASNYQIWMEFKDRTKIDEIMHGDDIEIDKEMAIKLSNNLDIIDDEKITDSQILPYLNGKTRHKIKLDIILSTRSIGSLQKLFDLDIVTTYNDTSSAIKSVNYARIDNMDVIDVKYVDEFMSFIFKDIVWIDQKIKNNSNVISFQMYHTDSIINTLNKRKQQFCEQHDIPNQQTVTISSYKYNKIYDTHQQCKMVVLHKGLQILSSYRYLPKTIKKINYNSIEPVDLPDIPYCFKLKDSDSTHDGIICQLQTNNARHEWITHIDYAMYKEDATDIIDFSEAVSDKHNKMMNDFTYEDDLNDEEFSKNFNFGIYYHYWQAGYTNSVIPKYSTLKTELISNKYASINIRQYYELYTQCVHILNNIVIKADDIGVNNKKFKIPPRSLITINHLISLKLYTDFGGVQNEFKKHCRRRSKDESLESMIQRNMEIAHWCRYLKESCTFYGELMDQEMVVYTGLKNKLMFNSMMQHFECPLSTTIDVNVANRFAEGTNGIILKMKAANPKTRYFDVSWLSQFSSEKERLFMGSSLKIIDILISCKPSDNYISAIQMFEQVINGQFIDGEAEVEVKLLSLLDFVVHPTIMDQIYLLLGHNIYGDLQQFLKEEQYDTDSIVDDIEESDNAECSNIAQTVAYQEMMQSIKMVIETAPSKYVLQLFSNFLSTMKRQNESQSIWLNHMDLSKNEHDELKMALTANGRLFDQFGINKSNINSVQQYKWIIDGDKYQQFMDKKSRQYIKSDQYVYNVRDGDKITFHLRCYAKYSDASPRCALFLHLDSLPDKTEGISIEYDILCDKKTKYRHLMPTQWLSNSKCYCGFQTFPYHELNNNTSIIWFIGLKVLGIQYEVDESAMIKQDIIIDEEAFNITLIQMIQNNNINSIMSFCQSLYQHNIKLVNDIQEQRAQYEMTLHSEGIKIFGHNEQQILTEQLQTEFEKEKDELVETHKLEIDELQTRYEESNDKVIMYKKKLMEMNMELKQLQKGNNSNNSRYNHQANPNNELDLSKCKVFGWDLW